MAKVIPNIDVMIRFRNDAVVAIQYVDEDTGQVFTFGDALALGVSGLINDAEKIAKEIIKELEK